MTDKKTELYQILKKQKGVSLVQLAKELSVSEDFVLGMIESNKLYLIKENIIALSGLGTDQCIVCSENGMDDHNSIGIVLPKEFLNGYKLNGKLSLGIRGHKKCYSSIDVFFRCSCGLVCWDCSSWSGEWVAGDEVEEKCSKLKHHYTGHQGVIEREDICNFFSPRLYIKKEDDSQENKNKWGKIKSEIEQRTLGGYKNLVVLLEKARLLE